MFVTDMLMEDGTDDLGDFVGALPAYRSGSIRMGIPFTGRTIEITGGCVHVQVADKDPKKLLAALKTDGGDQRPIERRSVDGTEPQEH